MHSNDPPLTLDERVRSLIKSSGAIPLSVFMDVCLHDPKQGYYATNAGIGRDFITAPEISQLFGECIGIWCALAWQKMGRPSSCQLVEAGPGHGALIKDILRTLERICPEMLVSAQIVLIENSHQLQELQLQAIPSRPVRFTDTISNLVDIPTIIIGNEFLDCLPARKYIKTQGSWCELRIDQRHDYTLEFAAHPIPHAYNADLPDGLEALEIQPGLASIISHLQNFSSPLAALFVDYGPSDERVQDSFRAYSNGKRADPLINLGRQDLTVDVDFCRLQQLSQQAGLNIRLQSQASFLLALGLEARFKSLIKGKPETTQIQTYQSVKRLTDPAEMGTIFKAAEIHNLNANILDGVA